MRDVSCIWYVAPAGYCGPAKTPDNKSLVLCDRCADCGYEPRISTTDYKRLCAA